MATFVSAVPTALAFSCHSCFASVGATGSWTLLSPLWGFTLSSRLDDDDHLTTLTSIHSAEFISETKEGQNRQVT